MSMDAELDAIRKRLFALSEPHWTWDNRGSYEDGTYIHQGAHLGETLITLDDTYEGATHDCLFIEHAPKDIAALLALVKTLQEQLEDRELLLECERAARMGIVQHLGGTVEGAPTGTHNLLKRIDALRHAEHALQEIEHTPHGEDIECILRAHFPEPLPLPTGKDSLPVADATTPGIKDSLNTDPA